MLKCMTGAKTQRDRKKITNIVSVIVHDSWIYWAMNLRLVLWTKLSEGQNVL